MIVLWLIFKSYLTTRRWGHHSLYGNFFYNYTHAPNFESCIWSPGLEAKFLKPIYSKWLGNEHTTAVIATRGFTSSKNSKCQPSQRIQIPQLNGTKLCWIDINAWGFAHLNGQIRLPQCPKWWQTKKTSTTQIALPKNSAATPEWIGSCHKLSGVLSEGWDGAMASWTPNIPKVN